jgi:amino acid transporter
MTERVDTAGDIPGSERPSSEQESPHQFGLTAAMALIVGSIIGVGVFNLPTSLAAYGPITLISMALTTVGALVGWTMICAEMPLAAAQDGLFPARFKRMSHRQVPAFGIIASTALASVAMLINYLGSSGATVFTTLSSASSSPVVVRPPQAEADCSCCSWWRARQRDQPTRAASPRTTSRITPISALVPAAPMRLATSSPRK